MQKLIVSAELLMEGLLQLFPLSPERASFGGGVYLHHPDSSGCNWDVWTVGGRPWPPSGDLQTAIKSLKSRYNL